MKIKKMGGVPPLVTALIVIAFIVAGGIITWFVIYTTTLASKKAILTVEGGAYVIDKTLYLTVKNIGTLPFNGDISVSLKGSSGTYTGTASSVSLNPGESTNLQITLSASPTEDSLSGVIQYGTATVKISVDVIKS